MTRSTKLSTIERSAKEFAYILMVKASTFPVYVDSNNTRMEPDGSLLVRFLSITLVESNHFHNTLCSDPCLGRLDFLRASMEQDSKAQRKLNSLFQRRGCFPHSVEFIELLAQVDLFCSVDENTALDEIEYIKHNLQEFYDGYFETETCRLFAFLTHYDRDHTNSYNMVQDGYQRIAFDLSMLVGVTKY